MALAITSSANLNDSTSSYSVVVSGKLNSANRILIDIRIRGTSVATGEGTGTTINVSGVTAAEIYANAQGNSLSGAVVIYAYEFNSSNTLVQSITKSGNITINARNSSLSVSSPTGASPINLDLADPVNVIASWSRPHTAFRGRIKGYVWNGSSYVLVFNRYGYGTSANFDIVALGYLSAFESAMNGTSPRNFRLELYTQFDDGTGDYLELGSVNSTITVTSGVIKTYVTLSTIVISNFELLPIDMTVPFTLNTHGSYAHTVRLKLKKSDGTTVLIRTQSVSAGVTSGNLTIGATERNLILNALPTVTYATIFAEVDTSSYGTTNSQSTATTVTLHADFKPSIGSVSHAESSGTQYIKTALGYGAGTPFYLKAKSKLTFTVPITNTTGATTSNIRVQFAGTDKTQSTSPVTTESLVSFGTLNATITVTDSRGRSIQSTVASIVVRNYVYPKVDKFEVFRAASVSGDYDPLGTFLRCIVKGTATTVLALDGTTQKNWIKYKIDTRVKNTGSFSNNAAVNPGGLSFGELTTTGVSGFLVANAYDIRIRVFDAFYDLDNDASTLEDTDDYAEGIQILSLGKVALLLGEDYASIGNVADDTYNLTVGSRGINSLGPIKINGVDVGGGVSIIAEGTWLPEIFGLTTAGVGTYTIQEGAYTRIGNVVHFNVRLAWTAHTGSGYMAMTLPFTNNGIFAACSIGAANLSYVSGTLTALIGNAEDRVVFYRTSVGISLAAITLDTAATIWISGTYKV